MPRRVLSRTESKAITRRRLLDAAARVMREAGHGAVSTAAVARAAGIAQPTFYVHFRGKDDLMRTLGVEQMGTLRTRLREARQGVIAGRGVDAVRETFRIPLQTWVENAELLRLYSQEVRQPGSPLGEMARELRSELRGDLVEDLTRFGLPAKTALERERLAMIAESMIAQTEALALGYLDGTFTRLETAVDVLTRFAVGVLGLELSE